MSATVDAGLALFWVPRATPGLSLTAQRLTDGSEAATLTLDGAVLPPHHLLAAPDSGADALREAMAWGRLAAGAELLGLMRSALDLSLAHLRTREQFGAPLASFQVLRHRVVDLYLQQELTAAALEEACRLADLGNHGGALWDTAARVKARASAAALGTTQACVQFHGALGYTDECDAGLYLKRALSLTAWLGNASELVAERAGARQPPACAPCGTLP